MKIKKGELFALHNYLADKQIPDMSMEGFIAMMQNLSKTSIIQEEIDKAVKQAADALVTDEVKEAQSKLIAHHSAKSEKEKSDNKDILTQDDLLRYAGIFNEYKKKEDQRIEKLSDEMVEIEFSTIGMNDFDVYRRWKDKDGNGLESVKLALIFKHLVKV